MQSARRLNLLLEKSFVKIDKVESFRGAGHCGIEPAEHILGHWFVAKDTPIDKDRLPLSALRLVTGYGIGKLNLQGVEIVVLANLLQTFDFALDIEIILLDLAEKTLALLASERWRLGVERIEQHLTFNLCVVVVAKR